MENASKALIMAGGILIGVIVLSIGAYLFTAFGGESRAIQQQIDDRVVAEFNSNFLKYQGSIKCTIHDIVNLAKFAQKVNEQMEVQDDSEFYIHVYLNGNNPRELTANYSEEGKNGKKKWTDLISGNLVSDYTDEDGNTEKNIKYYKCVEIKFDNNIQKNRVSDIEFSVTTDLDLQKAKKKPN